MVSYGPLSAAIRVIPDILVRQAFKAPPLARTIELLFVAIVGLVPLLWFREDLLITGSVIESASKPWLVTVRSLRRFA